MRVLADVRAPRVLTLARRRCAGGERALLIAAKAGREDLVELLADFKADLDAGNAQGMTALHWASREGKIDMVQVLVKVGANVEAKEEVSLKPRRTLSGCPGTATQTRTIACTHLHAYHGAHTHGMQALACGTIKYTRIHT